MEQQLCIYINFYYVINHKNTAFTQNVLFTSAAVCGVSEGGGGGAVAWEEVEAALPDGAGAGVDTVTSSRPGIDANCITQTKKKCHQTRQQDSLHHELIKMSAMCVLQYDKHPMAVASSSLLNCHLIADRCNFLLQIGFAH